MKLIVLNKHIFSLLIRGDEYVRAGGMHRLNSTFKEDKMSVSGFTIHTLYNESLVLIHHERPDLEIQWRSDMLSVHAPTN